MELKCPVCNGIYLLDGEECPFCNNLMQDTGTIKDFLEPYSPYEENVLYNDVFKKDKFCTHLLACPECGEDLRATVKLLTF